MTSNRKAANKVAEIYRWLDTEIKRNSDLQGRCEGCGRCCDFASYGHRLFVTTPELMYLKDALGDDLKPMAGSRCPYNEQGKCTIYADRFAGCRIFCCKGDSDFQSSLSELAVAKFKFICEQFQIDYLYTDIGRALNG